MLVEDATGGKFRSQGYASRVIEGLGELDDVVDGVEKSRSHGYAPRIMDELGELVDIDSVLVTMTLELLVSGPTGKFKSQG